MFFEVVIKCGNFGGGRFIPVALPVAAASETDAVRLASAHPKAERGKYGCVLSLKRIDARVFRELLRVNRNDPFLNCRGSREQREIRGYLETRLFDGSEDMFSENAARKYEVPRGNKNRFTAGRVLGYEEITNLSSLAR